MKTFIKFIVIFSVILHLSQNQSVVTYVRLRSFKCDSSTKSINDVSCYIKSSREDVLASFKVFKLRKTNDAKFSYKVDRMSSENNFNTIIDLKDLPLCTILNGVSSSPMPFMKFLVDYVKELDTNFFEFCSSENIFIFMNNATFKDFSICRIFPPGLYATYIQIYDNLDRNILQLNATGSNIRKLKKKN